jgi:ADP-ribose pyrophosphatase YjhB (NUDIX family)
MVHSAGLAVIYKEKILLVHPKNARWTNSYSIPKGHLELGETSLEAAIRETKEEVGIEFHINTVPGPERELFYIKQKTGNPWKKLSYYVVHIDTLEQIGLSSEIVPKEQLQAIEVDWAGFVPFEEAKKRMIPALLKIIDNV